MLALTSNTSINSASNSFIMEIEMNNALRLNFLQLQKIILPERTVSAVEVTNFSYVGSLVNEISKLGYNLNKETIQFLCTCDDDQLKSIHQDYIPLMKSMVGDVCHKPLYLDFPAYVMEEEPAILFINSLLHYWTEGKWRPTTDKVVITAEAEFSNNITLTHIHESEVPAQVVSFLESKESIPKNVANIIEFAIESKDGLLRDVLTKTPDVTHKEILSILTGGILKKKDIPLRIKQGVWAKYIHSSTDILRAITYISGGDVSLAENTKFKSLPRQQRRFVLSFLEVVIKEEDIKRHKNKWVRLLHGLHYNENNVYPNIHAVAKKIQNNKNIVTIQTKINEYIKSNDSVAAAKLLVKRPGEFARSLDKLIRMSTPTEAEYIIDAFSSIVEKISNRVLFQLLGYYNNRNSGDNRVIFPKGTLTPYKLDPLEPMQLNQLSLIRRVISIQLFKNIKAIHPKDFGKVYIDYNLSNIPIPFDMRAASPGKITFPKGSRLPININTSTIRFFIYWVGQDIDLSVRMFSDNFDVLADAAYYTVASNTRSKYGYYHSGDIVDAPNGASEFIDIDIEKSIANGVRYLASSVYVYSGPDFKDHKNCFFGWMERSAPNSNDAYEPQTVFNKIDLVSPTIMSIPVIFDLKTMQAIWVDSSVTSINNIRTPNNALTNRATLKDILSSMVNINNKLSLMDLFCMHVTNKCTFVSDPKEADHIFSLYDVEERKDSAVQLLASDYMEIQSNWI